MSTVVQINQQILSWQGQFADAERKNDELQHRINYLDSALVVAKKAKSDAASLENDIKSMKANSWKGANHQKYESKKTKACTAVANYKSDIDEMIREIRARRKELQLQVNYLVKFISSCESKINSLDRQLRQIQQNQSPGISSGGAGVR